MEIEQITTVIVEKLKTIYPPKMTLELSKYVIEAVENKAKEIGIAVVVAIANEGARPIAIHTMDDAYIASYDIALNKAYTAVALKMATHQLKTLSAPGESLYGIQHTNQGQIIIFGGGEPLCYQDQVIGGLGVSGGTEIQDTELAIYGKKVFEEALKCQ